VEPTQDRQRDMKLEYHINDLGAWEPSYGHLLYVGRAEGPNKAERVEDWGADFSREILLEEKWKQPEFGPGVEMNWRTEQAVRS